MIDKLYISNFNYHLSDDKIAKYPLHERDNSKLLVYKNNNIFSDLFFNLNSHIPENSLMIFNNTKVIQARILFKKNTGANIEIFCLYPDNPKDYALSMQETKECTWNCMVGNLKKWKQEILTLEIDNNGIKINLYAEKIKQNENEYLIKFSWNNTNITFSKILELCGELPIPPYLKRSSKEEDKKTYQTLYSKIKGSVAAPTAGLHFTDKVLKQLESKNITTEEITLHVGAGTFKPVTTEDVSKHAMHKELIIVSKKVLLSLLNNKNSVIAVGTTSMRTIESLYYIGQKLHKNPNLNEDELSVKQWEPYEAKNNISPQESILAILRYLDKINSDTLACNTQIIIVPGYKFNFINAIITNFHQPQSTLLLLISAFIGDKWKEIYQYALDNNYRFLSYGDSSILWKI